MKNKEGVCKMCGMPLMVLKPTGKLPILCKDCMDKIQAKTKTAMQKRGKTIGNKRVIFVDE